MKIAVIGAGAVGCYFGGLLALAGHAVTFVGRKAHVDAINGAGLLIESADFQKRVTARATTDIASAGPADVVLFAVKSADTEAAGGALGPVLGAGTVVLNLQNGVDNAARLSGVIGRAAVPAVVYVGTGMAGPGHVKHHGGGSLLIGAGPQSEAMAALLAAADIPTTVSPDIAAALWSKLIINCAWNALSAIANLSYGAIIAVGGARELVADIVAECVAVARHEGVTLPDDMLEQVLKLSAMMPGQVSSTAQDLKRGKPTEVDFLNGHIVRRGREAGIATPVNHAIQMLVKLAEEGRRNPAL